MYLEMARKYENKGFKQCMLKCSQAHFQDILIESTCEQVSP